MIDRHLNLLKHTNNVVSLRHQFPSKRAENVRNVFECYDNILKSFLRRYVATEEDIADLAQDVYERLCNQQLKDGWEQFPKSYILKTATSVIRDRFRRRNVRHEDAHDSLDDHQPATTKYSPEQLLQSRQGIEIIKKAVRDLPPKQRKVFLLHRISHCTFKEISIDMNIPLRSVERYMSKALSHCRKRLQRAEWLDGND